MDTKSAMHNTSTRSMAISSILDNKIVSLELADFFLGDFLGSGESRYVFDYKGNKRYVIKIDCSDWNANVTEHDIWQELSRSTTFSKWLAPSPSISRCGRILMQRKVKTDIPIGKFPKKIPSFFNDTKLENWGMLEGRMVCFDYAGVSFTEIGRKTMKTAEWWSLKKIVV